MNLNDLLKQDRIAQFESDIDQIKNEIENATAKLKSAKNVLGINEWRLAYGSAYEAMLHAGRELMFSKGYRTKGSDLFQILESDFPIIFVVKN